MILSQLLGAFVNSSSLLGKPGVSVNNMLAASDVANPLTSFINDPARSPASNVPKAYLNYILFNDQLKKETGDFDGVNTDGTGYKNHDKFINNPVVVNKNGYLYIYVSNESDLKVLFDNLQVTHVKGALVQETHYYPFGLTMAGISSKAAGGLENKKKYNGIEFDNDLDINTYEAYYRNLDPQIGRWWQIDPKCEPGEDDNEQGLENLSPYNSMGNDPVRYSDPKGDIFGIDNLIGAAVGAAIDYGFQVGENLSSGKSWKQSFTQVDGKSIATSAAIGFVTSGVGNVAGKLLTKAGSAVITKLEPAVAKLAQNEIVKQSANLAEKGLAKTGASVLGKIGTYEKVAEKLGAKSFKISPAIAEKMTPAKIWEANVKFLDRMISRGDKIVLDAPIKNISEVSGGFRKELDYLVKKGFNLSKDGTMMVK